MSDSALAPILICFDGSDNAKRAIEQAARVLGKRDATVLHVWDSGWRSLMAFGGPELTPVVDVDNLERASKERSDRIVAEGVTLAQAAGFNATAVSRETSDKVWQTVVEVADADDAAIIVIGTRGLSTPRSLLMGSVSIAIIHHCARPVLVVPATTHSD